MIGTSVMPMQEAILMLPPRSSKEEGGRVWGGSANGK